MPQLLTWAGKSNFEYTGSVKDGTTIKYGKGFIVKVSADDYAKLIRLFSGRIVDIGTSRDRPPPNSLGKWLQQHVTKTAIASYVGPILIYEGHAEKIGSSQIRMKGG
jgi:hypothetical protein